MVIQFEKARPQRNRLRVHVNPIILKKIKDANRLEIGVIICRCHNDGDDLQYKNNWAAKEKNYNRNY